MGVYEGLKDAAAVLREADKIPQYQQILDAQKALLDMQRRIEELEQENRELKKNLNIKENLKYERNAYWTVDKNDGPFCSQCWDSDEKLVRTHPSGNPAFHHCPTCKTSVEIFPERNPPPQRIQRDNFY